MAGNIIREERKVDPLCKLGNCIQNNIGYVREEIPNEP